MRKLCVRDWNDIRLIIACAKHGGFAGAASALGLDQATVSRRIANLEQTAGRPLFHRKRSGANLTEAGRTLMLHAEQILGMISQFDTALVTLGTAPLPPVAVGASEGLLNYTLAPVLSGSTTTGHPIDRNAIASPLPPITFTTEPTQSDVFVLSTAYGEAPQIKGAMRVRRIGTVRFSLAAGDDIADRTQKVANFRQLGKLPLIDIEFYRGLASLHLWTRLCDDCTSLRTTVRTSRLAHTEIVDGKGVGLLPSYATLYDSRLRMFDVPGPPLKASLWLVAHQDQLREPAVRTVYDGLAKMFLASPWFRDINV